MSRPAIHAVSGIGDPTPPSGLAWLVPWVLVVGTAGLIFWGTLQPARRR